MEVSSQKLLICGQCAKFIPLSEQSEQERIFCPRCQHRIKTHREESRLPTIVLSLTALILYIPAMMFPFLTTEFYGQRTHSTIWNGVVQLFNANSYFVAIVIFLASIIFPLVKIAGLLYLSIFSKATHPLYNTWLYRVIEYVGRWSMLDIFVLAILVTIMKVRDMTDVQPEIGSLLFALVVVFTMVASASFDPQTLWLQQEREEV